MLGCSPNPLSPPLLSPLTSLGVQATEAEEAALGLTAGLGWLWAQLLPCPAAKMGVCGCTPIPPHPQYPHMDPPIPVHGADGGGELLLQPQQEALDQLVDAGLLPALWEPTGTGLGGPVPALGTQSVGSLLWDPPTLVKRGGTMTVGTLKKKL